MFALKYCRIYGALIIGLLGLFSQAQSNSKARLDIPGWQVHHIEASSSLWPVNNLIDGNTETQWTSQGHTTVSATEWVRIYFSNPKKINFIKLYPRFFNGETYGFPADFEVFTTDSKGQRNLVRSFKNFNRPTEKNWLILPFAQTNDINSVEITTKKLASTPENPFFFQLGEIGAGYHDFFEKLIFVGNDGDQGFVEFAGMGSKDFDPAKAVVWNYDKNNPIIQGQNKPNSINNIYAPNVVFQGGKFWNIYFGGQDGTPLAEGHIDRISLLTTNNHFQEGSFSSHVLQVEPGQFIDVNNESVIKIDDSHWEMVYTTLSRSPLINKPAVSRSADGAHWSPGVGSISHLLTMTGFETWPTADVNGTNSLFYENGQRYLFWKDQDPALHLSTSLDGFNYSFKQTILTNEEALKIFSDDGCAGINDVKKIGQGQYIWLFHCNTNKIWMSTGPSLLQMGKPQLIIQSTQNRPQFSGEWPHRIWTNPEPGLETGVPLAKDPFITSVGAVTDGKRLFGLLYGAGSNASLIENRIFARWLQHKVEFETSSTKLTWMNSKGPDLTLLLMLPGQNTITGVLKFYDSDGKTVLEESPAITIQNGDRWNMNLKTE